MNKKYQTLRHVKRIFIGKAYGLAIQMRLFGYSFLDRVLSVLEKREPRIYDVIPGEIPPGSFPDLCIFAHYDQTGKIDDYVLYYIRELFDANREIVFVSTSKSIDVESLRKAKSFCQTLILRENIGHDFGSWKIGLQKIEKLDGYRSLILANDSVYGPLQPLSEIFSIMNERGFDFWGITDSYEAVHHVQSYFLHFGSKALHSLQFRKFWNEFAIYQFRESVIWNGEISLSQRMKRAGFQLGALCSYDDLRQRYGPIVAAAENSWFLGGPTNPTFMFWQLLIREFGSPFLKTRLLRKNRFDVEDVDQWPEILQRYTDYDVSLIWNHLDRMERARFANVVLRPSDGGGFS